MINWHLDFFRDFSEICVALRVDPESGTPDDWDQYARRFADWKKTTANPKLVSGMFVLRPWRTYRRASAEPRSRGQTYASRGLASEFGGPASRTQQSASRRAPPRASGSPAAEAAASAMDPTADFANRFYTGGPLAGWEFEPRIPALVQPVPRNPFRLRRAMRRRERRGLDRHRAGPATMCRTIFFPTSRSDISAARRARLSGCGHQRQEARIACSIPPTRALATRKSPTRTGR